MKKSVDTTPYLAKIGYHIVSRARVLSWSYRRLGCEPYKNAMATNRLTSEMFEDGGVESQFDAVRACASGTTPHRRTAAVKLAARIFTALAIAFAISYVAARDFTPDASAAAGKIDVLNVGTCYATSSDVFEQEDCIDNVGEADDQYRLDTGSNPGIQGLETGSTVFATYAVDPMTSSDAPRAILQDADLIKISILDGGRDRRTPVLLRAGGAQHPTLTAELDCYTVSDGELSFRENTARGSQIDGYDREMCGVYKLINDEFFPTEPMDGNALLKYDRAQKFIDRAEAEANRDTAAVSFVGSRASGNVLEVMLPTPNTGDERYHPLHREVEDNLLSSDTVIKFYGYLQSDTSKGGCERITAAEAADIDGLTEAKICDLGNLVQFDEDVGSGNTDDEVAGGVAPWITFGMGVGTTDVVHIRYVYYLTSEWEEIIGDKLPGDAYGSDNPPRFTRDETSDSPKKIILQSAGDGNTRFQHLWLRETGRFTGRYEGFLRLTDPNGSTVDGETNWGRAVANATGHEIAEAAVLGVQGGPVTIRYRDYEGNTQTLAISIDTEPPEVLVETPSYKTNFADQRVRVVGTFNDDGSRLREDSFRMFLDNTDDEEENGEDGSPVFDLPVDQPSASEDHGKYGCVGIENDNNASDPVVQLAEDYAVVVAGDCSAQFGIIPASDLFKKLEDAGGDQVLAKIDPDDFDDRANEGVFDDIARLDIDTAGEELNNTVDFQGFVLDIAGNIGFTDSDATGPTFIHDFGTKMADRKDDRYNVLGWYSRHIISIDQLDPRLGRAVTGFYGENDDDEPLANVRGVMLLFDGAIDPSSVDNSTFRVELDAISGASATAATVVDIDVVGDTVYLLLSEDLLPDATPKLSINSGRSVRDPAGNPLTSNDDLDGIGDESRESESEDGIPPTFTIELSNGSGTGTGDEGPGKLTKDKIVVTVKSNEDLQGTPSVSFVCEGFTWTDTKGTTTMADDETLDMERFLSNRRGKLSNQVPTAIEPNDETGKCEDGDTLQVRAEPIYSRPGNTWEYEWRNPVDEDSLLHLSDGDVTVVAFGRDANGWSDKYSEEADNSYNWGATTTVFELDSELEPPTKGDTPANILKYGSVQPREGADVFETRPFVLLTFVDASTVALDSFKMNGTAQDINPLGNNRFLFWPDALSLGKHKVEVESVDAAGNEVDFSYEFEVKARTAFEIELLAGWNAVSVPAMPVNPTIGDVFTIAEVDQVVSWDSSTPGAPWRIATKVDGVWSTNAEFAPLDRVVAGKGYWVHANGFVDQDVLLTGVPDRESSGNAPAGPLGISTVKGWNFVGVVDTDGDQTQEGDFGEELMNSKQEMVTATTYLRTYKQAYTWDPIKSQFNVIEGGDNIEIGDGIWVYYADGFNLAP